MNEDELFRTWKKTREPRLLAELFEIVFRELIEPTRPGLGHFSNSTTVSDLFQETHAKALESAKTLMFETPGSLRAWIKTVLRRLAIDRFRYHARRLTISVEEVEELLDAPPATLDVEKRELANLVRVAVGELPNDYAEVITRRYFQGRGIDKIAADMKRGPDAVAKLLERARKHLGTILLEE